MLVKFWLVLQFSWLQIGINFEKLQYFFRIMINIFFVVFTRFISKCQIYMRIPRITSNIPDIQIANISNELVRSGMKCRKHNKNAKMRCEIDIIETVREYHSDIVYWFCCKPFAHCIGKFFKLFFCTHIFYINDAFALDVFRDINEQFVVCLLWFESFLLGLKMLFTLSNDETSLFFEYLRIVFIIIL